MEEYGSHVKPVIKESEAAWVHGIVMEVKEHLSAVGGHHWIGKSVLSLLFFAVFYLLFARLGDRELSLGDTGWLIGSVVISGLAIVMFYMAHFISQ